MGKRPALARMNKRRIAFAAAVAAGLAVGSRAGAEDTLILTGVDELRAVQPTLTGAGVPIAQVEGDYLGVANEF